MVTHLTTSPPVLCLNRAERTGSLVFRVLWSYVKDLCNMIVYIIETMDGPFGWSVRCDDTVTE